MKTLQQQLEYIKQQQRLGFMTHVVMGYPSLDATKERVHIMAKSGVDIIELQLPFSDPIADGPAIMQANHQAIDNGVTVQGCMQLAAELSQEVDIPLIFIGYFNTVLHYGISEFSRDSAQAGIAGFTFPDFPFDEENYDHFIAHAKEHNLPIIQLVSPATTEQRLQQLSQVADTMVYCVTRFGVTGQATVINQELTTYLQRVRKYVTLPLAVGFGLRTARDIQQLQGKADIVVMGSTLLNIPNNELAKFLGQLCKSL